MWSPSPRTDIPWGEWTVKRATEHTKCYKRKGTGVTESISLKRGTVPILLGGKRAARDLVPFSGDSG